MNTVVPVNVEKEISQSLYRYIYNSVYSKPYSEMRHNVHLDVLFSAPMTNSFRVMNRQVRLPSSEHWFVYMVDSSKIFHINLPDRSDWTCLADRMVGGSLETGYCTDHAIDIRVVSSNTGKSIPRRKVLIKKCPYGDYYLIIISQGVMRACGITGTSTPNDIWFNFYYHHVNSGFKVTHYDTGSTENINTFLSEAQKDHTLVYLNGTQALHPEELTKDDIPLNTFAEIVTDPDIVGYIDVPVKGSYSIGAFAYTLFHIPKNLNPDNDILSHRVCDLTVYSEEHKNSALYVCRTQTEDYFKTLTHNDFAVHTGFLRTYAAMMGHETSYFARCYVRNHHRDDLQLKREANFTDCLYKLNDDEIVSHLTGEDKSIPCWLATSLADSAYAHVLDGKFNQIQIADLNTTVAALGYENSAEHLCKRVYHVMITPILKNELSVTLPMCFVGCEDLIAHIYIDGFMLDNDHVRYQKDKQCLKFTLDSSVTVGPYGMSAISLNEYLTGLDWSQRHYFTVEVFGHTPYRAAVLALDPDEKVTLAIDQDYEVLIEIPLSDRNKIRDNYLYKRFDVSTSYRYLTERETKLYLSEIEFEEGINAVTIHNAGSDAHTFYVVSKSSYAKVYGVEHQLREMNYDIFCSHLLMVTADEFDRIEDGEIVESNRKIRIPYLNRNNTLLSYLNHRELVDGLDCKTYQINTTGNCFCGQFTVFQNVDYLTVANNIFEVFSIGESVLEETVGFVTEGRPTLEAYWSAFKNTGMMFLDGRAVDVDPTKIVGPPTQLRDNRKGATAKIRALIPPCLKKILDKHGSPDPATADTVLRYMDQREIDLEAPAIIERSHHIYSIFLQTITEEVLRGHLKYNNQWTDDQIRKVLKPYASMIPYDLGLRDENIEVTDPAKFIRPPISGIDYRFVDVVPSYRIDSSEPDLIVEDKFPLMIVEGSNFPTINGTYYCINPDLTLVLPGTRYQHLLVDHGRYNDQTLMVWENINGSKIQHHDTRVNETKSCHAWIMYDAQGIPRYHAHDAVGTDEIWKLDWQPILVKIEEGDTLYYYELPETEPIVVLQLPLEQSRELPDNVPVEHPPITWMDITDGTPEDIGDPITIRTADVVLHTAGEFPGYRLSYTTNIQDRNFLTRVAKLYLKKDLVDDGESI